MAGQLSNLIHSFHDDVMACRFIKAFFVTQGIEWSKTDALRLDKFMMVTAVQIYHYIRTLCFVVYLPPDDND